TSLTAWRAASGRDMNSISYRPAFRDSTDLSPDVNDTASWALNGRGMHSPGNSSDINGQPRSVTPDQGVPDIGAFEFTPLTLPPLATANPAIPAPGAAQVFTFGE